jgi:hypothetical protein
MKMAERCFRMDEMDDLLDLNPSDPRQQHLNRCPLCRARLSAYRMFLAKDPGLSGSQQGQAEARLDEFIAREFQDEDALVAEDEPGLLSRFQQLLGRRRVMAPALVVVGLLALIVALKPFTEDERFAPGRLRGVDSTAVSAPLLLLGVEVDPDGTVTFRWRQWPEADSYRLQIFTPDLAEIAQFTAAGDTFLQVPPHEIPAVDEPLLWRIQALREGDEMAHSSPASLDLNHARENLAD